MSELEDLALGLLVDALHVPVVRGSASDRPWQRT
jgi:hypothetical protein